MTASTDILKTGAPNGGGDVASGSTDAGNPVKVGGVASDNSPTAVTIGQRVAAWFGLRGNLIVGFGDVTNNTDAVVAATQIAQNSAGNARLLGQLPYVSNGATADRLAKPNATARLLSAAASTNATSVKASAGNLHHIRGDNTAASKKYLKFYNKASAPTVGTDTPVLTFALAASGAFDIEMGTFGQYFSTGIAYAITGAAADADTTALVAGDIAALNITYS